MFPCTTELMQMWQMMHVCQLTSIAGLCSSGCEGTLLALELPAASPGAQMLCLLFVWVQQNSNSGNSLGADVLQTTIF